MIQRWWGLTRQFARNVEQTCTLSWPILPPQTCPWIHIHRHRNKEIRWWVGLSQRVGSTYPLPRPLPLVFSSEVGEVHSASRRLCGQLLHKNIPVSQESRNFSGLFRMPPIPLYLRNAEVLSHQISPSSCFSYTKNVLIDQLFKTSGLQFVNWLFGPDRFSEPSKNRPQIT